MHGICFEYDLQEWFDFKIPPTTINPNYIFDCLESEAFQEPQPTAKVIWLGSEPAIIRGKKNKKDKLTFHSNAGSIQVLVEPEKTNWLISILHEAKQSNQSTLTIAKIKKSFEERFEDFEIFWYSKPINNLRESGLLII